MRSVSDPRAIHAIKMRSECDPCDPRALIATTCDRLAVSSDDLRALATTYEDLFTSFPSISDPFTPRSDPPKLSILRFFTFLLVHTCILLSFCVFLIVLPFPIRISRFLHCRLHIFMYITLFHSKLQSDIVPPSLRTSLALAFRSYSTCAPRRNTSQPSPSPRSFLEPVSQPSRTLTPATAVVCFVLGTASGVPAHQMEVVRAGDQRVLASDKFATAHWDLCDLEHCDDGASLVVVDVDGAVVEPSKQPWSCWVEIDAFHAVRTRKELFLKQFECGYWI
jgi:hypothetical protein